MSSVNTYVASIICQVAALATKAILREDCDEFCDACMRAWCMYVTACNATPELHRPSNTCTPVEP
jgi:hypothetical protein